MELQQLTFISEQMAFSSPLPFDAEVGDEFTVGVHSYLQVQPLFWPGEFTH